MELDLYIVVINSAHNASAMHTAWSELDSTTELCSTEETRRTAINKRLADRSCSDYVCGKYSHIIRDTAYNVP